MTSVTGHDSEWIESADRAARALRAAAFSAVNQGVSPSDAIRIFQDGVREALGLDMTTRTQRTMAQIAAVTGWTPNGELLPELDRANDNGRDGEAAFATVVNFGRRSAA